MSKFNSELKKKLDGKNQTASFVSHKKKQTAAPPKATNISGSPAYNMDKWLKLLSMLNTLKLEQQYYKSESQQIRNLKAVVIECAKENPYFTAQCIVYSRCLGEGLRSVSHVAAVTIAPYISGQPWAKYFYSAWNKKTKKGGVIFRTDDMSEIMAYYKLNNNKSLPASMKKGFAMTIEGLDLYNFGKYTKQIRDVANMVHPNPWKTPEISLEKAHSVAALDYIMRGNNIPAHTWENAQSEAGQEIARAVREGNINQQEAQQLLQEAKEQNWNQLLSEGRLGIMAALRNIRSILLSNPTRDTVNMLCALVSDPNKVIQGKIMPYHFDIAIEVINNEFNSPESRRIVQELTVGYKQSIPNFAELLTGNTLVIVDQSGSMWMLNGYVKNGNRNNAVTYKSYAGDKACLLAATIAKATNADIIRFGSKANYVNYKISDDVFTIASGFKSEMGSTNLAEAWKLASTKKYDRVFIFSDHECNVGNTYKAYQDYIEKCGRPYVYSVDLAAYGTTQLVGPKVHYIYGYGNHVFEQIKHVEFNPNEIIQTVKSIEFV